MRGGEERRGREEGGGERREGGQWCEGWANGREGVFKDSESERCSTAYTVRLLEGIKENKMEEIVSSLLT